MALASCRDAQTQTGSTLTYHSLESCLLASHTPRLTDLPALRELTDMRPDSDSRAMLTAWRRENRKACLTILALAAALPVFAFIIFVVGAIVSACGA